MMVFVVMKPHDRHPPVTTMRRLSIFLTPAACLFGCADDSAAGPAGTEGDESNTARGRPQGKIGIGW